VIAVPSHLKGRDYTRVLAWTREELQAVLDLAAELKRARARRQATPLLPGRTLGMIFHKPSTRTRVSFGVGIWELGGLGLDLPSAELQLGRGEPMRDTALVLSRYLDALVIRTFAQRDVEELAAHAQVPVINGLSDEEHPCQALADLMTIRERLGGLEGVAVAYVGDGNNVCVSLMHIAVRFGLDFAAATPPGYEPPAAAVEAALQAGGRLRLGHDPREAVAGADVVYTDVWTSMGQEEERERRLQAFRGFSIDSTLLALASERAIVLHCLPAHVGEEISAEVLYGPRSAVWEQAENRLHTQKALMALVIP
jgi:ornithine carbamoyltransferase